MHFIVARFSLLSSPTRPLSPPSVFIQERHLEMHMLSVTDVNPAHLQAEGPDTSLCPT